MSRKLIFLAVVLVAGVLSYELFVADAKTLYLPGATSHGHAQIEMSCDSCHTPFGGVTSEACNSCHEAELTAGRDSHPKTKFDDPRNVDLVEQLDARECVTCHNEHKPEITDSYGVTLPKDYCVTCHEDVGDERPSHEGLPFDGCATNGCHNYHDNTGLYEDHLAKHLDEPDMKETLAVLLLEKVPADAKALTAAEHDGPSGSDAAVIAEWARTTHAAAGVNCSDCHTTDDAGWRDTIDYEACASCHENQVDTFQLGKHGMRLAVGLPPMRPEDARLPMKAAAHGELGCGSCHGSHAFDTQRAAVDACVSCHDDAHTQSWEGSAHAEAWREDAARGASCATCHMPRVAHDEGKPFVMHNQNANLRPTDKMVTDVCTDCHGLGYALDAIADEALVRNNFRGQPTVHVESLDWVASRVADKRARDERRRKKREQREKENQENRTDQKEHGK